MMLIKYNAGNWNAPNFTGIRILNREQWKVVLKAVEEHPRIYLGEYQGKHSEVFTDDSDFKSIELLTDNEEKIKLFKEILKIDDYFGSFDLVGVILDRYKEEGNP